MSSSIRALSPGSSLSSYDFFTRSRTGSRVPSSGSEESEGSYGTASEDDGSSDDEILLSFSDLSSADFRSQRGEPRTPAIFSDDEFVLMSRPRSPESDASDLTEAFSALSLSQASIVSQVHLRGKSDSQGTAVSSFPSGSPKKRGRKRRAAAAPGNAAVTDTAPTKTESSSASPKHHGPSKARRNARRAAARAGEHFPSAAAGLGDRPIVDDVSEVGSESPYIHQELYQSAQRYVSSYVLPSSSYSG